MIPSMEKRKKDEKLRAFLKKKEEEDAKFEDANYLS